MRFFTLLVYLVMSESYDFYIFSRSWVPGFCLFNQQKCHKNYPEKFSIHGLWPTWENGTWPEFCPYNSTNYSRLNSILPDLNYHWSQDNLPQWSLWQHEFIKHGSCAVNSSYINSTYQYFSTTLWLDLILNVNYLVNSSITPSNNISYNKLLLIKLFNSELVCENYQNKSILIGIRNKLSKDLQILEYKDQNTCNNQVWLIKG